MSSSVQGQPAASSFPPSAFLGVSCVLRGVQLPSQVGRGEDHHARHQSWLHAALKWEGGLWSWPLGDSSPTLGCPARAWEE